MGWALLACLLCPCPPFQATPPQSGWKQMAKTWLTAMENPSKAMLVKFIAKYHFQNYCLLFISICWNCFDLNYFVGWIFADIQRKISHEESHDTLWHIQVKVTHFLQVFYPSVVSPKFESERIQVRAAIIWNFLNQYFWGFIEDNVIQIEATVGGGIKHVWILV